MGVRVVLLFVAVAAGWPVFGCDSREPKRAFQSAEFGVLYGGQIQERTEIPFVIDATKQQQGFRVTFPDALPSPVEVRWEVSRPGPIQKSGVASPDDRVTELGVATVPKGAKEFEQRFSFRAGDPLGLWNIRVTVGSELAIDRPFQVFDRAARKRARQSTRQPDAGR